MMNKRLLIAGMAAALSLTAAGAPVYAAVSTTDSTAVEQSKDTEKPSDDKMDKKAPGKKSAEEAMKEGNPTPDLPEGITQDDSQTPPEKPDGDDNQTPPEKPNGDDNQTPPEKPDGDDNGQTPSERPDGDGKGQPGKKSDEDAMKEGNEKPDLPTGVIADKEDSVA